MLLPKHVSQLCNRAGCRLLVAIDCLLSGGSPAGQSYSQTGTDDNDRRNFSRSIVSRYLAAVFPEYQNSDR